MDISDLFSVKDKVVLVTGGGRGVGRMIAHAYACNGARVYIASRKESECMQTAKVITSIGKGKCIALPGTNLGTEDGCKELAKEFKRHETHLDVLVNNSGATWGAPLESYPDDAWDKLYALNVKAVFNLTRALLPLLKANATNDRPSSVINIGSIDGLRVSVMETYAYSATKAAVHHLTRVLANKLAESQITVNAIAAGPFQSKMMDHTLKNFGDIIISGIPMKRIGNASDIGAMCLYLSSRGGSWVTGNVITLDGGTTISAKM